MSSGRRRTAPTSPIANTGGTRRRTRSSIEPATATCRTPISASAPADAATGAVSCVAGVDNGTGASCPGPGSSSGIRCPVEARTTSPASTPSGRRSARRRPSPNSCEECANYIDNGAGLSWNVTIPAGGSVTRSHLTVFSPLGIVPLTTTQDGRPSTVTAGRSDSYTITIDEPEYDSPATLDLDHRHAARRVHVHGRLDDRSHDGGSRPWSGQVLTWNGSVHRAGVGHHHH